jgi:hypothetical protein
VIVSHDRGGNTSTICVKREAALSLLPGTSEIFCRPIVEAGHGMYVKEVLSAYRIHNRSMTDRSPTSAHTAFFAQTSHCVADRLEEMSRKREVLPNWAVSYCQLLDIARRYRAEGFTKDWERALELPGIDKLARKGMTAMWAWLRSGRLPELRHLRYAARSVFRYLGIELRGRRRYKT